ncbi:DUF1326 domain-containing protein [Kitasatospora camelliae]|uniref:DUF1326 domain-containing protein n=1 Tax=Kitasatospora camelliae TaxID=3156397 RepID=UPI003B585F5A
MAGDWFDTCKCAIPCTFAQPPTSGDCEDIMAWRIREGVVTRPTSTASARSTAVAPPC